MQTTKTISLIGADARFTASIAQLLKLKTHNQYALGDSGELVLIDADSLEGRKIIDKGIDLNTILLTVSPENFSHDLIVKKPIKIDELLAVIEKCSGVFIKKKLVDNQDIPSSSKSEPQISGNPFAKYMDPNYIAKYKKPWNQSIDDDVASDAAPISVPVSNVEVVTQVASSETSFEYWLPILQTNIAVNPYEKTLFNRLKPNGEVTQHTADMYCDLSDSAIYQLFIESRSDKYNQSIYSVENEYGKIFLLSDGVLLSNLSIDQWMVLMQFEGRFSIVKLSNSEQLLAEFHDVSVQYCYSNVLEFLSYFIVALAQGKIINNHKLNEPIGLLKKKEQFQNLIFPHAVAMQSIWEFRNVSLLDTIDLLPEINEYYIFSYYTLCVLFEIFDNERGDNKSKAQLDLSALLSELQKL